MAGTRDGKPKTRFSCWRVGGCLLLIVGTPLVWSLTSEALWWHRHPPQRASCIQNLKQLSLAVQMYATDYDERMPRVRDWSEVTMPYARNELTYHCPKASTEPRLSYGMNPDLSGRVVEGISGYVMHGRDRRELPEEVMLFDGRLGMVIERHEGGANYGFADGHAKWLADPPAGILVAAEAHEGD